MAPWRTSNASSVSVSTSESWQAEGASWEESVTEEMMESLFEKLSCCPGAAAHIHMMLEAGGLDVIHKEPASGDSKNAAEVLQEIWLSLSKAKERH